MQNPRKPFCKIGLWFADANEVDVFIASLTVALCDAITNGWTTAHHSDARLFNRDTFEVFASCGASASCLELLKEAGDLTDVETIIQDRLPARVKEVREKAAALLASRLGEHNWKYAPLPWIPKE